MKTEQIKVSKDENIFHGEAARQRKPREENDPNSGSSEKKEGEKESK